MTTVCAYPTSSTSNPYGYMAYSFSRHANNAGLALPSIPRRSSSTSSASRSPARSPPMIHAVLSRSPPLPALAKVVVQPPTPPDASHTNSPPVASTSNAQLQAPVQDDVSSGSGSDTFVEMLAPKMRRARGVRGALPSSMRPPEQSTPTPAMLKSKADKERVAPVPFPSFSNDDTPRASTTAIFAPKPRPGISPLSRIHNSNGSVNSEIIPPPRSASVTVGAFGRKKSGEPLKSSLKSRRPIVRGDLSVVTGPLSSKSEPSTPTCIKSVHFDSQLEHVKLFLAEQKPLAVSRDGSPTDDTSGTESDFPAFIYGKDEDKSSEKGKLEVVVHDLREEGVIERDTKEVRLLSLQLGEDGTSMVGRVRVRNLAFEKWIAIRFTCDGWQTTSEVAAKYVESLEAGKHDVFQFTVRLNDMMGRIEEKAMLLAVRYSVIGREMWDNNGGENYKVSFKRQKVLVQNEKTKAAEGRASGIAVLKSKLEKVAQAGEDRQTTVGGFLSSRAKTSPPASPSTPGEADEVAQPDSFTLKSSTPLSSRYDFSVSLKSQWRHSFELASPTVAAATDRSRTRTYPTTVPNFPRRGLTDKRTLIELTRGSPRILDNDDSPGAKPFLPNSDLEATPVPPSVAMARRSGRNHQRGYFDLGVAPSASGVRRTPPGSPFGAPGATVPVFGSAFRSSGSISPSGGRSSPVSAPPVLSVNPEDGRMWRVASGGSEESTPSTTSNEESSRSASPSGSPYEGPVSLASEDSLPRSPSPGDGSSYSAFLNK